MSRRDGQRTANVLQIHPLTSVGTGAGIRLFGANGELLMVSTREYSSLTVAKQQAAKLVDAIARCRIETVDATGKVV